MHSVLYHHHYSYGYQPAHGSLLVHRVHGCTSTRLIPRIRPCSPAALSDTRERMMNPSNQPKLPWITFWITISIQAKSNTTPPVQCTVYSGVRNKMRIATITALFAFSPPLVAAKLGRLKEDNQVSYNLLHLVCYEPPTSAISPHQSHACTPIHYSIE